ncbi:MAG: hypothetical protein NTV94_03890 [Planctomycetota bacterium]|nr:hypothetical protein [Planctomycetota bacterium]
MRAICVSTVLALACVAHGSQVTVDGKCNIFGAGLVSPPGPGGGGGGVLPVVISLVGHAPGYVELTSVTGFVTAGATFPLNGADGGTSASGTTDVLSLGGISGLIHANRTLFLTGLFLGPASTSNPAPPRLDVTGANEVTEFSPLLAQTFFMGDGRDAAANMQRFFIPAGATRLYLGFVDALDFGNPTDLPGHYDDNAGSLQVTTNVIPAPAGMSVLGLAGLAASHRRRRVS